MPPVTGLARATALRRSATAFAPAPFWARAGALRRRGAARAEPPSGAQGAHLCALSLSVPASRARTALLGPGRTEESLRAHPGAKLGRQTGLRTVLPCSARKAPRLVQHAVHTHGTGVARDGRLLPVPLRPLGQRRSCVASNAFGALRRPADAVVVGSAGAAALLRRGPRLGSEVARSAGQAGRGAVGTRVLPRRAKLTRALPRAPAEAPQGAARAANVPLARELALRADEAERGAAFRLVLARRAVVASCPARQLVGERTLEALVAALAPLAGRILPLRAHAAYRGAGPAEAPRLAHAVALILQPPALAPLPHVLEAPGRARPGTRGRRFALSAISATRARPRALVGARHAISVAAVRALAIAHTRHGSAFPIVPRRAVAARRAIAGCAGGEFAGGAVEAEEPFHGLVLAPRAARRRGRRRRSRAVAAGHEELRRVQPRSAAWRARERGKHQSEGQRCHATHAVEAAGLLPSRNTQF